MNSLCLICKNKLCNNCGRNIVIGWDCPNKEGIKDLKTEDEIIEELSHLLVEIEARSHGNSGIWFESNLDYVHLCEWGKELFNRLAYGEKKQ